MVKVTPHYEVFDPNATIQAAREEFASRGFVYPPGRLEAKIDAGADFVQTQIVFDHIHTVDLAKRPFTLTEIFREPESRKRTPIVAVAVENPTLRLFALPISPVSARAQRSMRASQASTSSAGPARSMRAMSGRARR